MSLVESIFGSGLAANTKDSALGSLFGSSQGFSEKKSKKPKTDNGGDRSSSSSSSESDSGSDSSSSSSTSVKEKDVEDLSNKEKRVEKETEDRQSKTSSAKTTTPVARRQENTPEAKADEEARTIFVGNLPLSTTRKSLAKLFADCGKVASARLRSVATQGVKLPQEHAGNQNLVRQVASNTQQFDTSSKSNVQGYVVFQDKESVEKALQLNNKPVQDEHPHATRAIRRIRVDTATPTLDSKRSVFVGNLPYGADEATLQDHFVMGCGVTVKGVRIVRDRDTLQCKGIAYVLLEDTTMVATALQQMHNSMYMNRPIRVKVCGKANKNKNNNNSNKRRSDDNHASPNKKQQLQPTDGAVRRVLGKDSNKKKKKRARGEKKSTGNVNRGKPGVSKRAAADAKAEKRVKQLKKRISKGMGKARKT